MVFAGALACEDVVWSWSFSCSASAATAFIKQLAGCAQCREWDGEWICEDSCGFNTALACFFYSLLFFFSCYSGFELACYGRYMWRIDRMGLYG